MKVKLQDDVDLNVNIELPTQDLEDLIDKVADAAIKVAVAITVCQILKSIFTK